MTLFEVVDSEGRLFVLDAETHSISGETGGPVVHDFAGIRLAGEGAPPDDIAASSTLRFIAPQSVREVPA